MDKKSSILADLVNIPRRGSEVASVEFSTESVTVRFDDGTHLFSHVDGFRRIRDEDGNIDEDHQQAAVGWANSFFNTSSPSGFKIKGLFTREEVEFLMERVLESKEVATSKNLRELIYRAAMPFEALEEEPTESELFDEIFEQKPNPLDNPRSLLNALFIAAHPDSQREVKVATRIVDRMMDE